MLTKRQYGLIDLMRISLRAAPASSAALLIMSVIVGVLPSVNALTTAHFIDTALAVRAGDLARAAINLPILLVVIVVAVNWFSHQASQFASRMLTLNLRKNLRTEMLEVCAQLEYRHIENPETWDLISRVTKTPEEEIHGGFAGWGGLTQAITLALNIASIVALLAAQVWWAAIVTAVFSVPLAYLAMRGGKEGYQATRDTEREERIQRYLIETLLSREAAEERALFGYVQALTSRFRDAFLRAYKLRFRVEGKWFLRMKLSSSAYGLIALLIAFTLIFPTVRGQMSVGMFMSLTIAAFSLVNAMSWNLSSIADTFAKKREYMKDVTKFMDLSRTAGALAAPQSPPMAFESLELKNVSFVYPGTERKVLDGLSLSIRAGEHVFFVGVNGAGKTTLTKLITALYGEYEGEILLNGRELRTIPQDELKSLYAVVFQDFARYQIPMRDNAAFGIPEREARFDAAVERLNLQPVVDSLAKGADTPLGRLYEDGQEISGGEWQRVAIARALVNPAPVRILDEPTAALDPIAEADIYQKFKSLSQGVTTLFISHRLGSTKLADRIYVLGEGKVLECGTHDQLMENNALYAQMYESQRSWYQ
ncbi:MAG: ABC transporter ATP-binding protein [Christensenellales bacterium]|jgi:ATP-binding cassette subfamily B protein